LACHCQAAGFTADFSLSMLSRSGLSEWNGTAPLGEEVRPQDAGLREATALHLGNAPGGKGACGSDALQTSSRRAEMRS
jgi:hypothetical protein